MTMRPKQNPIDSQVESLPDSFESELREVDALLRVEADREAVPLGLSARIFAASAGLLPQPQPARARAASWPSFAFRRQWWGRLAMAASLVLVFVLGSMPFRNAGEAKLAMEPGRLTDFADLADLADLVDVTRLTEAEIFAHLYDALAMNSEDILGEVDAAIAALEM